MKRSAAFIVIFAAGALLMFAFDSTVTLLLGMALQVAAIILGVFAIAKPEFLRGDARDPEN